MTASQWELIAALFDEISELEGMARTSALQQLAESQPAIYSEVLSLLVEDESPHPMLNLPQREIAQIGDHIGAYRLVRLLGSGGMGSVFLAERSNADFHQEVALKLVRVKGNQQEIERHFREERQILARLRHPHIAALYDGGISEQGQPYFTMEYVEGQALSRYCEAHALPIRERLTLFLQVCDAVDYAHRQLIAHLDLKPGNILVNQDGNAKLLDFGLAQMAEAETEGARVRFTLAYASPEQLQGQVPGTASDIYSLGVILYELIAGQLPHRPQEAALEAWKAAVQTLPDAPAGRSTLAATLPDGWGKDLDHICLHALQPEPEKRYGSVQELADDLRALLLDQPISLRRMDSSYRARKYLRRNRTVAVLVAASLALLIGLAGFYTYRLQQERNLARQEATKARKIVELMKSVFLQADPMENQGEEITARQLLDQALDRFSGELDDQPAVKAELIRIMGETYSSLNLYEQADSLALLALQLEQSISTEPRDALAASWILLGDVKDALGEFDTSDSCLTIGVEMFRQLYGETDSVYLTQLESLATSYYSQDKFDAADSLYQLIYSHMKHWYRTPNKRLAGMLHLLGAISYSKDSLSRADSLLHLALEMKQSLYQAPHTEIAYTLNYLASTYRAMKDYEQAKSYAKASLAQRRATLGNNHVETMASQANLSRIYSALGQYDSAQVSYDSTLAMIFRIFGGKEHYYYGGIVSSKATLFLRMGDLPAARNSYLESIRILEVALPPGPAAQTAFSYDGLGVVYYEMGQYAQSVASLKTAIVYREAILPPGHTLTASSYTKMARTLIALNQPEKACPYLEQALPTYEKDPDTYAKELADVRALQAACSE